MLSVHSIALRSDALNWDNCFLATPTLLWPHDIAMALGIIMYTLLKCLFAANT